MSTSCSGLAEARRRRGSNTDTNTDPNGNNSNAIATTTSTTNNNNNDTSPILYYIVLCYSILIYTLRRPAWQKLAAAGEAAGRIVYHSIP